MIENKLSDLEVLLTSIKNTNVKSYATVPLIVTIQVHTGLQF